MRFLTAALIAYSWKAHRTELGASSTRSARKRAGLTIKSAPQDSKAIGNNGRLFAQTRRKKPAAWVITIMFGCLQRGLSSMTPVFRSRQKQKRKLSRVWTERAGIMAN